MSWIIKLYVEYRDVIDLIKDIIYFLGALVFFHTAYNIYKFLRNKKFTDKSNEIKQDLNSRIKIEEELTNHVLKNHKNEVSSGIRFIYWKNYPYNLSNDGFVNELFTYPTEQNTLPSGFIDKTGINFVSSKPWFWSKSVYVDKNGIFFLSSKGKSFSNFQEFSNAIIVSHLPFRNFINYDFMEFIEYEPVFYIRYPYDKWKKLYDDKIILRNKEGEEYFMRELSQRNGMRKYSWLKYNLLRSRILLSNFKFKKKY